MVHRAIELHRLFDGHSVATSVTGQYVATGAVTTRATRRVETKRRGYQEHDDDQQDQAEDNDPRHLHPAWHTGVFAVRLHAWGWVSRVRVFLCHICVLLQFQISDAWAAAERI